jgi:hypothetical protein|tara:strand:+ start:145 stop:1383 length:1239 start_codon:yes stop_codon:yes gene_type:complete
MKAFLYLNIFVYSVINAQILFTIKPEISQSTWLIPVSFQTNLNKSVIVKYSGQLFDTEHPNDNYIWYSYHRNGKTYINTESYVGYNKNALNIILGRKYNQVGNSKMSGLFISPTAASLDQATFSLEDFHGFNYRHSIIRLDNRFREIDGVKNVVNRWYYLNQIGYNYKNIIEINFTDAVIVTGYNRGLEWYYANPLVSLFMERKHELHRTEGQDSTSVIGIGDNDNHFVGGDWKINYKKYSFYGEWLIDEWQLTTDHRDNMQTVFGTMVGVGYKNDKFNLEIEYSYASPWLYLNRALYGGLEKHYQPLGLRVPQSHSLDISFEYSFTNTKSVSFQTHLEERGDQTLVTVWNAWDNNIDQYDFTKTLPVEWKIIYNDLDSKYFSKISLYHHWLGSDDTFVVISKDWSLEFSSD